MSIDKKNTQCKGKNALHWVVDDLTRPSGTLPRGEGWDLGGQVKIESIVAPPRGEGWDTLQGGLNVDGGQTKLGHFGNKAHFVGVFVKHHKVVKIFFSKVPLYNLQIFI